MEEIFRKRFAEELKYCNLTKKQFAEMIGVSPEMVTQYCTTKKLPKLDTFARICKALQVSADYLLGFID